MSGTARGADMGRISAVLTVLLRDGKLVFAADPATGQLAPVSPQLAAAPHGFLPLLLAAGDTVWREATGHKLGVGLRRDPDTVLGFRADRIAPGPAAPVLLSVMEAVAQAERPEMLVLDDLKTGWTAAQERMRRIAPQHASPPAPALAAVAPPARPVPLAPSRSPRRSPAMSTLSRSPWWTAAPLLGVLLAHSQALASQYRDAPGPVGIAVSQPGTAGRVIERCILAAAAAHRVPPAVLVILLHVEGGQLGRVSGNTNTTVDIGPMQVNEIWLPELARHWHTSVPQAFLALRDDFCFNVEAGAWILRRGLDDARGDFWEGVGYYHSRTTGHKANYLRKVLLQALRLQAAAERGRAAASASMVVPEPAPAPVATPIGAATPAVPRI